MKKKQQNIINERQSELQRRRRRDGILIEIMAWVVLASVVALVWLMARYV